MNLCHLLFFSTQLTSTFIDQQMIKLQELPDMIPMGELPRHIQMTCDRYLANRVVPGTRVTITGLYTSTGTKLSVN